MKTIQDWSDTFDTLNADYVRRQLPGTVSPMSFDEYEKSVFLTLALELLILGLYTGVINGSSFELTEELRRKLEESVLLKTLSPITSASDTVIVDSFTHTSFTRPEDCWYIVYESAKFNSSAGTCLTGKATAVIPVTHDDYSRVSRNPFKGPNSRKILRLDSANCIELVSVHNIDSYTIRYIKRPYPIILVDLTDTGLDILGKTLPLLEGALRVCELPELLHYTIVDVAVKLAILSRVSENNNKQ